MIANYNKQKQATTADTRITADLRNILSYTLYS